MDIFELFGKIFVFIVLCLSMYLHTTTGKWGCKQGLTPNPHPLPFLHIYYTKFIISIYLFTNFEFSQKFPMKSQIFLHTEIVPIALCMNDEK